jgi:hypothetical protein
MIKEAKFSRRGVLLGGGAAAAAGVVAAAPFSGTIVRHTRELVASSPLGRAMLSLGNATYEEWLGQVGAVLTVGGGGSMRVAGVQAFAQSGARPSGFVRDRAFTVFFDPVGAMTMAGELIYTARHAQYGALQLFLSSSGNPRTPARMFAVFN